MRDTEPIMPPQWALFLFVGFVGVFLAVMFAQMRFEDVYTRKRGRPMTATQWLRRRWMLNSAILRSPDPDPEIESARRLLVRLWILLGVVVGVPVVTFVFAELLDRL
jgi:hypothetical protein